MSSEAFGQFWHYIRRVLRILRRPGGPAALNRHLDALERETRPTRAPKYCSECGSTDFEPTMTQADQGRVRVLKLRCRACGHTNSF
jgi:hypothetical protein